MSLAVAVAAPPRRSIWRRGILSSRKGRIGFGILVGLLAVAVFAPLIAPHDPNAIDASRILAPPDLTHPFGSDALGRDVLSRVIYAYRVSLGVAVGSTLLAFLVGVPLGLYAGYHGGWVDTAIMRPIDMVLALPAMLLAVALIAVLGPGTNISAIAIAIIYMPILARVVRSSTLVVASQTYIEAARARGTSHRRIIASHVFPNAVGPAIVQATVLMGFALQIEAALSFLGLGAQPPTPSLGSMLADGRDVLTQAPWVEIFPGVAIAITVLAFNFFGDGLRLRLDPRGVAS
ncbi:MAG TPA: ABC transporter permease [Actinomycetota bacterium]|nr:ABC transporter permease [Actinomycetota bacterium]